MKSFATKGKYTGSTMKYHSKPITVFPVDNDGIKWKAITFQNDHIHRERKKKGTISLSYIK